MRRPLVALGLCASFAAAACSRCAKDRASGAALTPGAVVAIAPARAAYVTNNISDSISVLDRDATTVTTIAVDVDPSAHEGPHHLAIDSAAGKLFVALAFPTVPGARKDPHAAHGSAADVGRLARLDLATLSVLEAEDVDESPGDVVLTQDRTRVLVTHFDMKRAMNDGAARGGAEVTFARLTVFDATTMKKRGSRAICTAPHGVVTTKDGKTAYVACYGSDELAVVDLDSEGFPTSHIPIGAQPGPPGAPRYGPYSATLSPDESHVVVADLDAQDVRVFDRATKKFLPEKVVPLGAKAFMPAFVSSSTVLVPTQAPDGLVRVDLEHGRIERRVTLPKPDCSLPHVVRVARDSRVYLVCEGDHKTSGSVLELDPETLAVRQRWSVGTYPDGIAFGDE